MRLYAGADVNTSPGSAAEKVLCGLAGVLAPTGVPLLAQYRQKLDIGGLSALATNALAATLLEIQLKCCNFELQHWAALCSLRSLEKAILVLQPKVQQQPIAQPPFTIQSMQLTNLHFLQFSSTRVELAAPLLAHAAGLTSLETLYFVGCNLGTLPEAAPAVNPRHASLSAHSAAVAGAAHKAGQPTAAGQPCTGRSATGAGCPTAAAVPHAGGHDAADRGYPGRSVGSCLLVEC